MTHSFKRWSHEDVHDLIDRFPLGLMMSPGADGFTVTPLPMLPHCDDSGRLVRLEGHMALRNPRVDHLRRRPRVRFVFQGPHGYISPTIVSRRGWGPTWNYAVAWIEADVVFRPGQNHAALQHLVRRLEGTGPDAWSTERMGERYAELSERIIAFDADIRSVDATFKLGQDESAEAFEDIVAGLDNADLVAWMRRFRDSSA